MDIIIYLPNSKQTPSIMQNLPTDSLYKFCALSGILILLVSSYFPFKLIETINSKVLANKFEISRLGIETEFLEKHLVDIEDVKSDDT